MLDALGRPLKTLRISVTDRCNLRCHYCMPEDSYHWLPGTSVLSFEELARLAGIFVRLGVERIRLTGGEPLLRSNLAELVTTLSAQAEVRDLALTTNGSLLRAQAVALRSAGLGRLTVSLDTLRADRFLRITRRDGLARVLDGLDAAEEAGFEGTKLDAVVVRGSNDDELGALIDFGRARGLEVRFIEYMDVGGATRWSPEQVVSRAELLARIAATHGPAVPAPRDPSAPAERFRLGDGTCFGIIASTSRPFCGSCDRARLTADGTWLTCLYAREGLPLGARLRAGASDAELEETIRAAWSHRADRGAEVRHALRTRGPWVSPGELRADARLEMHTRGG